MQLVIMNTGTTQNLRKAITNEYIADDYYAGVLVFQRGYVAGKGTFFAVPVEDIKSEAKSLTGIQSVTLDTGFGNRRGGEARLVGTVAKDGSTTGTVPTTAVPVYVFK